MTTILLIVASFVAGALTGYLALRNNPTVKAALDRAADKGDDLISKR